MFLIADKDQDGALSKNEFFKVMKANLDDDNYDSSDDGDE